MKALSDKQELMRDLSTYEVIYTKEKAMRPKLQGLIDKLQTTQHMLTRAVKFDDDGNLFFSDQSRESNTEATMQ